MALQSMHAPLSCYKDLVSHVLEHSNYDPTMPILIDASNPHHSVSLCSARAGVRQLVQGLSKLGVQPGDTVCLHMFNDIMYPVLFLGIVGAGGVFTGSNPAYTATELGHHFRTSETRFVVTQKQHLSTALAAASDSGISHRNIILLGDDSKGDCPRADDFLTVERLMACGQKNWSAFDDETAATTTTVTLMSTSGTTGLAKMAARSHHSWVTENQAIEDQIKKPYKVRRLLCVPFFHGFAAPLALISALHSGHITYVMRKFDKEQYLTSIERFQITETGMPPPLIVRCLAMPEGERKMLKGLQLIWSGGAPISASTQNNALELFAPTARICQVWGMTECGWGTTFHYPESDFTGSVGRLIGSHEAKLIDDNGNEIVGAGLTGEICVRGPINMSGYHGNPSATEAMITKDGWLKTGDVAYHKDGKIYIIDRQKELIKVRGWQVAPVELESVLLLHDDVVDAAVIGIPVPEEASEVPRAYVVLRAGSSISTGELKHHLLQSLAKYKVIDCEVCFRDAIPKSASGKILKNILRKEAQV